jgi:hypothetical protein
MLLLPLNHAGVCIHLRRTNIAENDRKLEGIFPTPRVSAFWVVLREKEADISHKGTRTQGEVFVRISSY